MRLTFRSLNESQIPNDTYAAVAFSIAVSVGAFAMTRYLGRRDREVYIVKIKDYKVPLNTVYKVPGIYVTKEEKEEDRHGDDT